jgi:hypothetical protein
MKKTFPALLTAALFSHNLHAAESITEALTSGTASANLNLRYESVEQDNALKDATAMTLRTRLAYTTGSYENLSAMVEMEDTRIVGGYDEYTVVPTGFNPGEYSVIGDPQHTELDQAFIQYKTEKLSTRLGRQVITYDGQRFVGHVGWRQDRQTFDALKLDFAASEALKLSYSYIYKRNRIFAEAADVDSKDSLLNVAYKTAAGTLTGYGYLLEVDNNTDNALDTFGISFNGASDGDMKIKYKMEFASQTSENGASEFDADYLALEASGMFSSVTATLGYESLGSDNGSYGFSTPLATLHKFNGWADLFLSTPNQGLVDTYVSLSGKLAGLKLTLVYHDFSADDSSAGIDDLGSEIDFALVKKFGKHYTTGIKYATYSAGDSLVDTDKLWVWGSTQF